MNKQCNEKVIEHKLRMVELLLHHVCKHDGVYKTIKTKSGSIRFIFLNWICLRIRIKRMRIRNHELSYRESFHREALSTEKGGAVLYSDFVTIFRLASLQFITKLAMSQSQSTLPQSIK